MPAPGEQRAGPVGAYGLRVDGAGTESGLLQPVPATWPSVTLRVRTGTRRWRGDAVDDERALLELHDGGGLEITRATSLAVVTLPPDAGRAGLAHPYLAPVAAVVSHWLGRESFHAGAVVVAGAAWAVLGDGGAGKSSLLARLALDGAAVLADDMVVLDGSDVFAGPRALDLRGDAAAELEVGVALGKVGTRERWRVRLDPVPVRVPLRGWVTLAWGEELALEPVRPPERLAVLARYRAVRLPPADPGALLRLAALPGRTLRRPRSWSSLGPAAELLLEGLGGPPARARRPGAG